ncbi:MAG TPA: efflux RND transporter periplasmic adaptor subunit [Deltaproteobacteria bacterium]|nr:efflux RND transporter periplasmic adaptor subunit [Deltaproteobacteria bacterium]
MEKPSVRIRIIHLLWSLIPWAMVAGLVVFIVFMGRYLAEEQGRLAEAKTSAIKKEVPAVRVITLSLKSHRLEDKINLPGEVKAYEDLRVKAEVKGQVIELHVEEGQYVKKGQILARLDDRDYRSRLARIEAGYKLAQLDRARVAALAKKKFTAESKLDEASARFNELGAQLKEAKLALERTTIVAPISGRLNELIAKQGELLDANQEVAQILQIDKVKVAVGVPESDVAAVFDLEKANVVIAALENRRVVGKKIFLARQPRTLARLYDLELIVPNPDGKILPGMFAQVELVKKVYPQALSVPLYAVIIQGDDRFVYIEKEGKAYKKPVDLGFLTGWQVQVKSGLNPEDRVIVVGHRFLDNDQPVKVIKNVNTPEEIFES